jgi:hypothetical protein
MARPRGEAAPRGARLEAFQRLGGRYDVRVLEPSPPAVDEPPFFADDPVAGGEVAPLERPGTRSWHEFCEAEGDDELRAWCSERWLGGWRPLNRLPASFAQVRESLHTLAEHVLAPARHAATGKIGLRYTHGGFGTPFFDDDRQIRIEGNELVSEDRDDRRTAQLTTIRDATIFAGIVPGTTTGVYVPTTPGDPDSDLIVDDEAVRALGDWFGFAASVLEQLRAEGTDASRVQIWPEHFDMAVDLGAEAAGRRANYGCSPGDTGHPEPYLYIGPWTAQVGTFWNEQFGASFSYRRLLEAGDQRRAALEFLRRGRSLLGGDTE